MASPKSRKIWVKDTVHLVRGSFSKYIGFNGKKKQGSRENGCNSSNTAPIGSRPYGIDSGRFREQLSLKNSFRHFSRNFGPPDTKTLHIFGKNLRMSDLAKSKISFFGSQNSNFGPIFISDPILESDGHFWLICTSLGSKKFFS